MDPDSEALAPLFSSRKRVHERSVCPRSAYHHRQPCFRVSWWRQTREMAKVNFEPQLFYGWLHESSRHTQSLLLLDHSWSNWIHHLHSFSNLLGKMALHFPYGLFSPSNCAIYQSLASWRKHRTPNPPQHSSTCLYLVSCPLSARNTFALRKSYSSAWLSRQMSYGRRLALAWAICFFQGRAFDSHWSQC